MKKTLFRDYTLVGFMPLIILAAADIRADPMTFSYTFTTDFFGLQPYAPGSKLFGQIDGTVDPIDANRVIINSFGAVSLSRPGFPLHTFASIEANEFNSLPSGNVPVMSFDGAGVNFRACPSGFTNPVTGPPFDDCPFALEGGFLVVFVAPFNPAGFVTAADGSDDTVCVPPPNQVRGCRVSEFGYTAANWSLAVLPDGVDSTVVIDPTVTIGVNTSVNKGVVLEENVDLGNNVAVNQNTSIGSNTVVGNQVVLNKDGDVGSSVLIGDDVTIGQKVVIESGVQISDGAIINRNVYICSDVVIGTFAVIGKNQVVKVDVPDTGELPGTNPAPDPEDPAVCL